MAKTTRQRRSTQQRESNPWIIIGLVAIGVLAFGGLLYLALRTPEAEPVLAAAEFCNENEDSCAFRGETDAPITMVEVSDFGCPHCQAFHNETAELLEDQYLNAGSIRWIALPYALNTTTVPAAAAAMCAGEQGAYFEFTNAMYEIPDAQDRLSATGYQLAATAAGIDLDTFQSCVASGRHINTVNDNREIARANEVTGTPTFFVNGEKISGAQPITEFQRVFESLLAQQ